MDALDAYDWGMLTYPRNSIEYRAGFSLPKNKRNGRKQAEHIKRITLLRDNDYPNGEWRNKDGASQKAYIVKAWRDEHPDGKKIDCERETGLSRHTVLKWWQLFDELIEEGAMTLKNQ